MTLPAVILPAVILAAVMLAAGIWTLVLAAGMAMRADIPLPLGDQWWYLGVEDHLRYLFTQHNEHRIVLPHLLFIADLALFGGGNVFNYLSIFVLQALHAVLLVALARRAAADEDRPRKWPGDWGWVAGAALAFLFWGYQRENIVVPFQAQFVGVFAAGTAAFLALSAGRVITAVACAAAAVATMANGVLVPLALPVLALQLGRPRRDAVLLALAAIVLIAAYLAGYVSPRHHANPLDTLAHHTGAVVTYAAMYIGGPAGWLIARGADIVQPGAMAALRLSAAAGAGAVGWLAALGLALGLLVRRDWRTPARLALLYVLALVLGTAVLTALGRANFPAEQALAERYGSPALVFWITLLILLWSLPLGRGVQRTVQALAMVWALAIAATQPQFFAAARDLGRDRMEGMAAILAGADSPANLEFVFPPSFPLKDADRLRDGTGTILGQQWTGWRGRKLADVVHIQDRASCAGGMWSQVSAVATATTPAWRIVGTLTRTDGKAPRRIVPVVLTDETGRVIGYGVGGGVLKEAWRGFAVSDRAATVAAYALNAEATTACPLDGGPIALDPVDRIDLKPVTALGDLLAVSAPSIDGAWMPNGFNPVAGPPPVAGDAYGTGARADGDTGRLVWRVAVNGLRQIALPVVTGPVANGTAIVVSDPATGAPLARLTAPSGLTTWQAWTVHLPADRALTAVDISAEDAGTGWGQWIAIAQPHALR